MIRAILWAARTYIAAHLLLLVAVGCLLVWVPVIGKPIRSINAITIRCALRLIGIKMGRSKR